MVPIRRPMPIESHRRRHILRAVVIEHTTRTTSMWWWKQQHPSLKVRFVDEDFSQLRDILERENRNERGGHLRPLREVEVGYDSTDERNAFAVGEEVEVMFSTAGTLDRFFTGAQPHRWDGLRKKLQHAAA